MKFALLGMALVGVSLLAGCSTTKVPVIKERVVVATVPSSYYICPVVKTLPNPDALTNAQVAGLILTLDQNNHTCKNSLDVIKAYQAKVAKSTK